jgi:hypothetical protein
VLERGVILAGDKPVLTARDRLRPVGELTSGGWGQIGRGGQVFVSLSAVIERERERRGGMSMEIETGLSDQIARYLDLAAARPS